MGGPQKSDGDNDDDGSEVVEEEKGVSGGVERVLSLYVPPPARQIKNTTT